jgi:S-adenosylmethionine:diacylglycerol 3-amino-3-carboxypropyl transferase
MGCGHCSLDNWEYKCDLLEFQVYLSNIFERLELGLSQCILREVVDNIPSGGRVAYCTLLDSNKPPSTETLEKLTYLQSLSVELQKIDRMIMYSGFHVFSVC